MLLALDNLATPLVGAPLSWRQSLSGAQFGTLVGKLLFKVFIFTLIICGYIVAASWTPRHTDTLLLPILPILVVVGVPLLYAYIKLIALRLRGLGISAYWLFLLYPLTEALRIATGIAMDVLAHNHHIVLEITAYTLQRSLMFLVLTLMALPSPQKKPATPRPWSKPTHNISTSRTSLSCSSCLASTTRARCSSVSTSISRLPS